MQVFCGCRGGGFRITAVDRFIEPIVLIHQTGPDIGVTGQTADVGDDIALQQAE
jgi:hypothetical protein